MSLADPVKLSKSGFSVKRGDLRASSFRVNFGEFLKKREEESKMRKKVGKIPEP